MSDEKETETIKVTDLEIELFIPGFYVRFGTYIEDNTYPVIYTGEMRNNKPHGKGILKFEDPDDCDDPKIIYDGNFKDGLFNGEGIFKVSVESDSEPVFENGDRVDYWEEIPIWRTYITTWINGIMKDGPCILIKTFPDLGEYNCYRKFKGNVLDNKLHGIFIEILEPEPPPTPMKFTCYEGKESYNDSVRYRELLKYFEENI